MKILPRETEFQRNLRIYLKENKQEIKILRNKMQETEQQTIIENLIEKMSVNESDYIISNLTGRELVEQGIITGEINDENIQQHGVDLNVIEISKVIGKGFIPKEGKTEIAERELIKPYNRSGKQVWTLYPGSYEVTFSQGCKVPSDKRLKIIHRSSLARNGGMLISALFDAGFETERIGSMITLNNKLKLEVGARIGQIYSDQSNTVDNLYNGQFQNDKQRIK